MKVINLDYELMFGRISPAGYAERAMPRCACVACNSCTCACSCRRSSILEEEIDW